MIKLYIDFDGVILNTIDITYKMFFDKKREGYTSNHMRKFYKDLDWEYILSISKPINNSVLQLKELYNSDIYDVEVLSHVNSDKEAFIKQKFLDTVVPGINLIAVNRDDNKCDVVDCKDAVLVDDYMGNLDLWYEKGGIPVKFSDKGKNYDYLTISSLDMLLNNDIIKEKLVKTKIK